MFRTFVAAFAAMIFSTNITLADSIDPDAAEDMAYYTPDYKGDIAPLSWDPNNSPVHPGLASRIMDWLPNEYSAMSQDWNLRFAGPHMVVTHGAGSYLEIGVVIDLQTGRAVAQLPLAGAGGYADFTSDCDLLGVSPPHKDDPSKVTEVVHYRFVSNQFVLLDEKYPECMTYGTADSQFPTLPLEGPFPRMRADTIITGSVN